MTVEEQTPPPQQSFETLSILRLIKDAQQKHGLRHGDYMLYRAYCARRARRLRKALKFTHQYRCVPKHRGKFSAKSIVPDVVQEQRFLELAVFEVERNWAYAMQLKFEAGEDPLSRKKFHLRQKLRKAMKHSANLEQIAKQISRIDATTRLEAQAYNAFIRATYCLEMKLWADAVESYKTVKTIYEKLRDVVKIQQPELEALYTARCAEVQNTLRLCESITRQQTNVSDMVRLKLEDNTTDLSMEFDTLLSEIQSKTDGAEQKTIRWGGQSAAIANAKVKQVLEASAQLDNHLKQTTSGEARITLYEKFLGDLRDVIQKYGEEHRKNIAEAGESGTLSTAQITLNYLEFLRLCRASERYLQLLENTRAGTTEKKAKPQDYLRLYDQIIENSNDVLQLPGAAADQAVQTAFHFKVEFYKAYKSNYMAEAYALISKWSEAGALYERAMERFKRSEKLFQNAKGNPHITETKETLAELQSLLKNGQLSTSANRISDAAGADEEDQETYTAPLYEQLDEWRRVDVEKLKSADGVSLVRTPPALQPMPCKPLFFDIAQNHIRMPDMSEHIAKLQQKEQEKAAAAGKSTAEPEQQGGGIGGLVKGFFWGKK